MDGQGDGDHNGPNRHHIHIPTEDQPPNGDNNDMEFIFLLHFIINHHMRVFRQNQIGFVNENIVNVHIENHAAHIHQVIEENEDELDNDFADEVQMVVNQVIEAGEEEEEEEEEEQEGEEQEEEQQEEEQQEEPQPGPSRYRSRDDAEQDEETRIRKCSRWWHEFDNTSDSSVDLDNDEEPLLVRYEGRSRDRSDSADTESVKCVHELVKNCSDLAEERGGSAEGADLSGQAGKTNSLPGPSRTRSTDEAGNQFETTGHKYFQWWLGVEDTDLDVGENPPPGDSENKSRDDLKSGDERRENDFRSQDGVSSMPNCVHQVARSIQDIDLAEEGQASVEDGSCSAQEAEEHSGPSKMSSRKIVMPKGGASKEAERVSDREAMDDLLPAEWWTENSG
ncbi:histone acetyltransferase KAT6B-like isoform X2 [Phycodurus eques]|nr:histone acetyltransferase KAT6B-like isoform X2 [Phycodurus eques]